MRRDALEITRGIGGGRAQHYACELPVRPRDVSPCDDGGQVLWVVRPIRTRCGQCEGWQRRDPEGVIVATPARTLGTIDDSSSGGESDQWQKQYASRRNEGRDQHTGEARLMTFHMADATKPLAPAGRTTSEGQRIGLGDSDAYPAQPSGETRSSSTRKGRLLCGCR